MLLDCILGNRKFRRTPHMFIYGCCYLLKYVTISWDFLFASFSKPQTSRKQQKKRGRKILREFSCQCYMYFIFIENSESSKCKKYCFWYVQFATFEPYKNAFSLCMLKCIYQPDTYVVLPFTLRSEYFKLPFLFFCNDTSFLEVLFHFQLLKDFSENLC